MQLAYDTIDVKSLWNYLQTRHEGARLVQQVQLLQALTTKCMPIEILTKTINRIYEKVD